MKAEHRIIAILLIIIISLSGFMDRVSASERTDSDWANAYIECLNNFYDASSGKKWPEIKEYYKFSLVDITGNGIPELIMITEMEWLPCAVIYFDGEKAYDYQRRYVQSFYICPGQGFVRMEWFVKGRTYDDIFTFNGSDFAILRQGWHGLYGPTGEMLAQEEFYWSDDPTFRVGSGEDVEYVQITEEEYKSLINGYVDESQATVVSWDTYDYASVDELMNALDGKQTTVFDELYPPYPTIALQSQSTGCYITCDIGAKKDNGQYEHFDDPTLRINATQVQWYEMFNLVKISDASDEIYALQSDVNRQYLKRDYSGFWWKGLKSEDDFIEEKNKVRLNLKNDYTTIEFIESGSWVTVENGELKWSKDSSKAERFKIIYLSDNKYDATEKEILSSNEWFNLDGKGVGYWNVQDEIGKAETSALIKLGYTPMKFGWKPGNVIKNQQMQCAVGVKLSEDGIYDVLITFQGTGGDVYGPLEGTFDSSYSIGGGGIAKDGMHKGYTSIVRLFEEIQYSLSAYIDGDEIRFRELLEKAKKHEARFIILGHSMGGAMAQIYAVRLNERGVPTSQIQGRTFNSALALTPDQDWPAFTKWYNLCISTDSVANGLVKGSIDSYGIFRIGKTIWLYDNEPAEKTDRSKIANIAEAKHNMDKKLKEILIAFASN